MQIKIFEAENMGQALKLIKDEFGPEAVILSSKTLNRRDARHGLPKPPRVAVTAAMDYRTAAQSDSHQKAATNLHSFGPDPDYSRNSNTCERKTDSSAGRNPFAELYRNSSSVPCGRHHEYPDALLAFHRHMLTQGVNQEIALELITSLRSAEPAHRLSERCALKRCLVRHLRDMGLTARVLKVQESKQSIVAFVGTTGVGKTTTIAKLAAAAHARKHRNSVGLITLDNHRIAAVEQLRIYGNIMGVPVQYLSKPRDIRQAVRAFRHKDLIFVDTAGLTRTNRDHLKDLGRVFARLHSPEIHLLLSASTKEAVLMETVQMAESIPFGRLLFTKLDETSTHGSLFNLVYRTKTPISYFTNGQDIPEGIQAASLGKLIDLIMTPEKTDNGVPSIVPRILGRRKSRSDLGISHGQECYRAARH